MSKEIFTIDNGVPRVLKPDTSVAVQVFQSIALKIKVELENADIQNDTESLGEIQKISET